MFIINILILIIPILLAVAFLTLVERKVLGFKIPDSKFLDFSPLIVYQTTNKGQSVQRRISPDPEEFWATELIQGDLVAKAM